MGRFRTSSSAALVLAVLRCRRCVPAASSPPGAGVCPSVCVCVCRAGAPRCPPGRCPLSLQHPLPARPEHDTRPAPGTARSIPLRYPKAAQRHEESGGAVVSLGFIGAQTGTGAGFLSIITDLSWDEPGSEGTWGFPEKPGCLLGHHHWLSKHRPCPWSWIYSGNSITKLTGRLQRAANGVKVLSPRNHLFQ